MFRGQLLLSLPLPCTSLWCEQTHGCQFEPWMQGAENDAPCRDPLFCLIAPFPHGKPLWAGNLSLPSAGAVKVEGAGLADSSIFSLQHPFPPSHPMLGAAVGVHVQDDLWGNSVSPHSDLSHPLLLLL